MQIGLVERLEIHTKKAPYSVHYQKWCAILCNYRNENYEGFGILSRKIKALNQY